MLNKKGLNLFFFTVNLLHRTKSWILKLNGELHLDQQFIKTVKLTYTNTFLDLNIRVSLILRLELTHLRLISVESILEKGETK